MNRRLLTLVFLLLACAAPRAQVVFRYDDFATPQPDPALWEVVTEAGTGRARVSTEGGYLTVTGAMDRTGLGTRVRLGTRFAVEVEALGYTGVNQLLQMYGGDGEFRNYIEFGLEGTEPDGRPTVRVWASPGQSFAGPSPVAAPPSPTAPLTLRVERNGSDYRFLVNGVQVYATTTTALGEEARVVLYGFGESVSRWDNLSLSGPEASVLSPAPGARLTGPATVRADAAPQTASWMLHAGEGPAPASWRLITSGRSGGQDVRAAWRPAPNLAGPITFRLTATDAAGLSRSYWSTAHLDRAALWQPMDGQFVGPAFTAAVHGRVRGARRVRFFLDGKLVGVSHAAPFHARIVPAADGDRTLTAVVVFADGSRAATPPVRVRVRRNLYGRNPRVTTDGRAFVFPHGVATVAVGENDSYTWGPLDDLWRTGDPKAATDYVRMLKTHGVNVMRVFVEAAVKPDEYLESPLGRYNPTVVRFWDQFLRICERHAMTVLISPWDTFWINLSWATNPYNAANGGPCKAPHDFIVSPEARRWQKARIKYIIDRWGQSPAIFAIDVLNEFDIWWDATPQERKRWVDDIAAYTRAYELRKWGRVHMLTASGAWNEPTGMIADVVYRHPLFEWANTHLYYNGTVSDPKNIIDPALDMNRGVKYALGQIRDNRPYTDTESGPINAWVADDAFDNAVYHHESWAHFASGGAGPGMRWPYRAPHILTPGMHETQRAIAQVAAHLDWQSFRVANADARLSTNREDVLVMGSADARQALVWLTQDTRRAPARAMDSVSISLRGLTPGPRAVTFWNTRTGIPVRRATLTATQQGLTLPLPRLNLDMAITIATPPGGNAR